jgi:hypothetical protein
VQSISSLGIELLKHGYAKYVTVHIYCPADGLIKVESGSQRGSLALPDLPSGTRMLAAVAARLYQVVAADVRSDRSAVSLGMASRIRRVRFPRNASE